MFKSLLLIALFFGLSISVNAQEGWFKQLFNEKVTIGFPAEGKRTSESTYVFKDSIGSVYGLVMVPLDKKSFVGKTTTDTLVVRYKFIDMVVENLKAKMPKYTIGAVKINKLNDLKIYHLEGVNTENKSSVFVNMVLVDDISYSLMCILADSADTKNKDIFLNNITIEN